MFDESSTLNSKRNLLFTEVTNEVREIYFIARKKAESFCHKNFPNNCKQKKKKKFTHSSERFKETIHTKSIKMLQNHTNACI